MEFIQIPHKLYKLIFTHKESDFHERIVVQQPLHSNKNLTTKALKMQFLKTTVSIRLEIDQSHGQYLVISDSLSFLM